MIKIDEYFTKITCKMVNGQLKIDSSFECYLKINGLRGSATNVRCLDRAVRMISVLMLQTAAWEIRTKWTDVP